MDREFQIAQGDSLIRVIRGVRDEWVYVGFGGLQGAADAMHSTRQAVHSLHQNGIRNRDVAIKVHDRLLAVAKLDIPIGELLELPDHPWMGPERHDPEGRKRRDPKSRALRPLPPAQPAGRGADALSPQAKRRSRTSSRWTAEQFDVAA